MCGKETQRGPELSQAGEQSGFAPTEQAANTRTMIMIGTALMALTFLGGGLYVYLSVRKARAQTAHRHQIAEYQSALAQAKRAIGNNDLSAALERLQAAKRLPNDVRSDEVDSLLREAQVVISPPDQVLQAMSDEDFQMFCSTNALPPSHSRTYGPLNRCYLERLLTAQDGEVARRKAIRDEVERKAQARAERLAKEEADRKERQAEEGRRAEQARRDHEDARKRAAEQRLAQLERERQDRLRREQERQTTPTGTRGDLEERLIEVTRKRGVLITRSEARDAVARCEKLASKYYGHRYKDGLAEMMAAYSTLRCSEDPAVNSHRDAIEGLESMMEALFKASR